MRHRSLLAAVVGTLLLVPAASRAQLASRAVADSLFAALLGRARAGDTTVDFGALRVAYARSSSYDPMSTEQASLVARMNGAVGAGDTRAAAAAADSVLRLDFTNVGAHVVASSLAQRTGDLASARRHAAVARGLFHSYDAEHRGATRETPIVIVNPLEEVAFGFATGLQRTDRYTTAACGERVCDSVVFLDPRTGRDTTIHFDVTLITDRVLGAKR